MFEDDSSSTLTDRAEYEFGSNLRLKRRMTSEQREVGVSALEVALRPSVITLKRKHFEQRSSSQFAMYRDETVFPHLNGDREHMRALHEECDYSTDEDNIKRDSYKLVEDLTASIQFYIQEQPLDLIKTLRK